MPKKNIDLFGHVKTKRMSRLESSLHRFDKESFSERLARLQHEETIFPHGYSFLLPFETAFIFDEARMTFVQGQFVSTILLAQAYIEHVFQCHLISKGQNVVVKRGLKAMIQFLRNKGQVHSFLLTKVDELRRIRNPFTHLQDSDNPYSLSRRTLLKRKSAQEVLAEDAGAALALMYQVSITKL